MEIEEINIRKINIALFMCLKEGFPHKTDRCGYNQCLEGYCVPEHINENNHYTDLDEHQFSIEDLRYNTSYDWLLPVVLKMQAQTPYFIVIGWHRMDLTNGETSEGKFYNVEKSPLSTLFEVVSDCCLLIIEGNKKEHESLLRMGMFFEMYPQLTGDWIKDKEEFVAMKNKTH